MWWFYRLISMDDNKAIYSYGRETRITDGVIEISLKDNVAKCTIPSKKDDCEWSVNKAVSKFLSGLKENGYKEQFKVVIG